MSRPRWQSVSTVIPSPLSAIPGPGQPCTPWLPGSIPTTPLRAASRQLRYHAEGTETFETSRPTWVSVHVLNKTKDRPRNQVNRSQSSATFTTQATERNVSAHVAMVLVDVSLLDTKQMPNRMLTSFCQLHKSDQKHMSSHKVFTSRHGLFVHRRKFRSQNSDNMDR